MPPGFQWWVIINAVNCQQKAQFTMKCVPVILISHIQIIIYDPEKVSTKKLFVL